MLFIFLNIICIVRYDVKTQFNMFIRCCRAKLSKITVHLGEYDTKVSSGSRRPVPSSLFFRRPSKLRGVEVIYLPSTCTLGLNVFSWLTVNKEITK